MIRKFNKKTFISSHHTQHYFHPHHDYRRHQMGPDPSAINNVNDQMGSRCVQLLIMFMTRWGPGVFSYYHHWWIVPVIATHAGAVAGAWIYYLAIGVLQSFQLKAMMTASGWSCA